MTARTAPPSPRSAKIRLGARILLAGLLIVSGGLAIASTVFARRAAGAIGLSQTLYTTPDFKAPPVLSRRVNAVDLSFERIGFAPPDRFFSVRWQGLWDLRRTGPVDIFAGGDDEVRVFIDENLVIERNLANGMGTESRRIDLARGLHALKVEFVQFGGGAYVNVGWAPAGGRPRPFAPWTLFPGTPGRKTMLAARQADDLWRAADIGWMAAALVLVGLCTAPTVRLWRRANAGARLRRVVDGGSSWAAAWSGRYARVVRAVFYVAIGLVTFSACWARLPGWNPESLWQDDLVWAVITRAQDLRTMLSLPAHAPPGFFTALWAARLIFHDPEWSMQLFPFACGIVAIPVMAAAVWMLTRSIGLALVAAALTALNPLLAHYTVFVKQYSLDFVVTALLLMGGAALLSAPETDSRKFAWLAALSSLGLFFSVTSVFAGVPLVNIVALRSWLARRRQSRTVVWIAAASNLLTLLGCLLLRSRANEIVRRNFQRGFLPLTSFGSAWGFLSTQGRRLIETSLPSWKPTDIWNPDTVSWTLPFIGLGLVWLLARRSTRAMGVVVLGFYAAFLAASSLRMYPLGVDRTDIFAFPVAICLFVMGLHMLTEWLPRREAIRGLLGLAVAVFAVSAPIQAHYWDVDDAKLVRYLTTSVAPADGVVLSPNGSYLTAYYGTWPVVIGDTAHRSNATEARIVRGLTLHLPPDERPRSLVDGFLRQSRPARVWYVAFRTGERDEVLQALEDDGYNLTEVEHASKGSLFLGVDARPGRRAGGRSADGRGAPR